MFNIESIGQIGLSFIFTALKPTAIAALQDLATKNIHDYKAAMYTLNAGVERLKAVVAASTTKIDDTFLADVQQILTESATQNGITL